MPKFDVTIATCRPMPEPDFDEAPLLAAIDAAGLRARICAWHDPQIDWSEAPLTVIRSTWNYYHDRDGFLQWARHVEDVSALHNPASVVHWNSHKQYLVELEEQGVPVVPTELVRKGEDTSVRAICGRRSWNKVVVKPAVSAGSFQTHVMTADAPDEAVFTRLAGERDVLVQPYVDAVDTYGERSVIVIDGEITHSVRKSPRFADQSEHVTGPHSVSADERDLTNAVLAHVHADEPLLYARVDMVPDVGGKPMLAELEIIEPSLFFRFSDAALRRLVAAMAARLPA